MSTLIPTPTSTPLRVSEGVTRQEGEVGTAVHFPLPSSHSGDSIPSTLSNTSTQHRPSDQSVPKNNCSPSSQLKSKSTISRHRHNSTSTVTTPVAHAAHSSLLESRNVQRPTSSPSPLSTSSQQISTPPFSSKSSYFSPKPGASGVDPRLTAIRRPPASRSSHGIETLSGPPPALSTQRSYTAESTKRQPVPVELTPTRSHRRPRSKTELGVDSVARRAKIPTHDNLSMEPSKMSSNITSETTGKEDERTLHAAIHQEPASSFDDPTMRSLEKQPRPLQEELLLNLTNTDAVADGVGSGRSKSEKRRSQISVLSSRCPPSSARPASSGNNFSGHDFPGHSFSFSQGSTSFRKDFSSPLSPKTLPSKDRRHAVTAHPSDWDSRLLSSSIVPRNTSRAGSGSNREASPGSPTRYGPRQSIREPSPGLVTRAYQQPNLAFSITSRYTSPSFIRTPDTNTDLRRRPQIHHAEGTESTVSTRAPSTIWDDIEDLKQRVAEIELMAKTPVTRGTAISSTCRERPPTASTTMTTTSSSPKYRKAYGASLEASTIKGIESAQIHPLLHAALARSKPLIAQDIYNVLEAAALDALNVAAMAGSVVGSENLHNSMPASGINRQLRQKADNMCRSLTELCVALAEPRKTQPPPARREISSIGLHQSIEGVQEPRYQHAASVDRETRINSRGMTQLEARLEDRLARFEAQRAAKQTEDVQRPRYQYSASADRESRISSRGMTELEARLEDRLARFEAQRATEQTEDVKRSRYQYAASADRETRINSRGMTELEARLEDRLARLQARRATKQIEDAQESRYQYASSMNPEIRLTARSLARLEAQRATTQVEDVQEPRYRYASSVNPETRLAARSWARLEAQQAVEDVQEPRYQHAASVDRETRLSSREQQEIMAKAKELLNRPDRTLSGRLPLTNGDNNQRDSARPASRATTGITHSRPSPSSRVLQEYTPRYPLSNSEFQNSPSAHSSLPVRRNRFSFSPSSSQQPPISTVLPERRRYFDPAPPPILSDNGHLTEMATISGEDHSRIGDWVDKSGMCATRIGAAPP